MNEEKISPVMTRHVAAFVEGDIDGLMADYDQDAVFITKATGIIQGQSGIRAAFEMVFRDIFPPATTTMSFEPAMIAGDIALLHWSAITPNFRSVGAFDSFVIRNGKIVAQTGGGEFFPLEATS